MLLNPYRFGAAPEPPETLTVIIASAGSSLFISPDHANTWYEIAMPTGLWSWANTKINDNLIAVDGGVAGTDGAAVSTNAQTWVSKETPAQDDAFGWYGVASDGSRASAVGQSDPPSTQSCMYSDDDGETWTMGSLVGDSWRTVMWVPELSLWIAEAQYGDQAAASSVNGSSYTLRTTTVDGMAYNWGTGGGAWNGSKYRRCGNRIDDDASRVMKSTNGTSYTTTNMTGVIQTGHTWGPTLWSEPLGKFAAMSTYFGDTYFHTSADGDTWETELNVITGIEFAAFVFDGTYFIVIEGDGTSGARCYYTTDFSSWDLGTALPGSGYTINGAKAFPMEDFVLE